MSKNWSCYRRELENNEKKSVFWGKFCITSGVLRVARGSSGAKAPPFAARPKLAGWGESFLMVYRNNAGRMCAGFISLFWETRWLGQKRGFYVPELCYIHIFICVHTCICTCMHINMCMCIYINKCNSKCTSKTTAMENARGTCSGNRQFEQGGGSIKTISSGLWAILR